MAERGNTKAGEIKHICYCAICGSNLKMSKIKELNDRMNKVLNE